MIRIGRIAYANCTPIFRTLQDNFPGEDYQLVGGVPARLNGLLADGELDVCPSSSIEYACHPERYWILPQLSISSVGAVGSVLLFSRVPIEALGGQTVLLSSESATSVNLLKILIEKCCNVTCRYAVHRSSLDEALEAAPALLLIGDAALQAARSATGLLVYDLGQLWSAWTGLPFVFALWLCRRQAAAEHCTEIDALAANLLASKALARVNLEAIAEGSPEAVWMGKERLVAYWRENISYELDPRHLEGLALFYRYCVELDLLKAVPEFHFFKGSPQREI